ncbi:MAG: LAGLIDADG family homing endonuclease [Candidatus Aenigmatarchaeota archaeon]
MRFLLNNESREKVFDFLKDHHGAKNLKDLSHKMKIPIRTLKTWKYGERYIPGHIIPKKLEIRILDEKRDNWGCVKGGKIGGKKNKGRKRPDRKKALFNLWEKYRTDLIKMTIDGKLKKRDLKIRELEKENTPFFTNNKVFFNSKKIKFTWADKRKGMIFPKRMSKELAEEIGIHLGDGCLSKSRHYFSVKCNKKEEEYVTEYLVALYKKLYNIDLKIMKLPSVTGFEIYSKALGEFKNKIIGLPYGNKVERTEVPESILKTKNKEVYCSFIRGLFDTDGCIYMRKKRYPIITISIKSKKLIDQTTSMLKKLGFIPTVYKWTISLNGPTLLNKWIKEINSSNPSKMEKLKKASSLVG